MPDAGPELTIVIATYNAAEYLPATLSSIERQGTEALARCEIVLVDGGSTDDTVSIAATTALTMTIVSEPDDGIYDAMNKGASIAKGEWLHFLNAGDTFRGVTALGTLLAALESSSSAETPWAVSGAVNLNGGSGGERKIPNLPHSWWAHTAGLQPHCHQATWVRRQTFSVIGGYSLDCGIVGDFDLILRLGILARPMEIRTVLIEYLGGGISEQSGRTLPLLLHGVRVRRLNLSSPMARMDHGLTVAVAALNRVRIALGAVRVKIVAATGNGAK